MWEVGSTKKRKLKKAIGDEGREKVKVKHIHNIEFDELGSVEVNFSNRFIFRATAFNKFCLIILPHPDQSFKETP